MKNFINGEFADPQSGNFIDNFNPSTGEVYSQVPDSDELDIVMAVQSASKAFKGWSELPAEERSQWLLKIADGIESRLDEFAAAESEDQGKPISLAKNLDIPRAVTNFRFFATRILHLQEMATNMDNKAFNYVRREPIGVAGLISPWNLPLYLLTWKIAPAIATGNTCIAKPSEFTSRTATMLGEVMEHVQLPPGVCNIVLGTGAKAGAALVQHPGVHLISFTGGTETGAKIQELTANQFKKTSLELGGKNSTIILKDADLRKAVPACIKSSFLNQGEICLCSERIFVHQDIYEDFLKEFVKQTEALKVGDPKDKDTFMGPLVSAQHIEKVKNCLEVIRKDKGEIACGGDTPSDLPDHLKAGYFLRPTVVTDLTDCSEMQQSEIFGPVAIVQPFKYNHEAVEKANTTPYGLSAAVFGKDQTKLMKVAQQLKVGTVWVNCWLVRDLRVPFGGMKASGIGREGGDFSMEFFTETKNICVQL